MRLKKVACEWMIFSRLRCRMFTAPERLRELVGLELSLVEGEIAGLAAAGKREAARELFAVRDVINESSRSC